MVRKQYPYTLKQERGFGSLKQEGPKANFRIFYTQSDGNTGKKSTKTSVPEEAIEIFDRWINEQKAGRYGIHQPQFRPVILKEIVPKYLSEKKERVSERYFKYEESTWKKIIMPFFGDDSLIGSISEECIEEYLRTRKEKGLSASAINHELQWIDLLFKYAIRKKWLPDYLKPTVRKLPLKKTLPNVLKSPKDFITLLEAAKNQSTHMYYLISFALYTGMRAGEILKLDWEDIDLSNASLIVRDPKNKHDRIVYLTKTLCSILEETTTGKRTGPIIKNPQTGNRLQEYKKAWKTIREKAGIPTTGSNRIRFHDLRHSFATINHANGVDIKIIKDLIGHKKIDSTLIYTHLVDQVQKDAIEKMDEIISDRDQRKT